jgi:two-component system, OmpR family, sensor histidine kinase PrrB
VRNLRGRLTLGVTLVLAGVLAVAGATASRYVEDSEREALDDRLRRTAELSSATARAAIEQELPENDRRLDAVLEATGTSLRLLLGDTVLLETGSPPPSRPAPRQGLRTFTADGRRFRSYTTTLEDPDLGGLALLQVTTPLGPLERRQADLDRQLLVLGAIALLLGAAGVALAAGLVLRPLSRLRAVASEVAGEGDLGRRVPAERGPGELRSLAESFNAMLARLGRSSAERERALAATQRFAADAGHELRTPLTSVLATLSALRRHPELEGERRDAMLDDALAEHRRLVDLLDGLQAFARGDGTAPEQADVDLVEVVAESAAAAAARHPGLRLESDLPDEAVVVRGWEPGLRLIADNLLENAARHGGAAARLTLRDRTLLVEDDGPGVPPEDRERVLDPFVRLDGAAGRPGSGLGLALVAQQARAHGGTVIVDDSPLGGARFTVALGG